MFISQSKVCVCVCALCAGRTATLIPQPWLDGQATTVWFHLQAIGRMERFVLPCLCFWRTTPYLSACFFDCGIPRPPSQTVLIVSKLTWHFKVFCANIFSKASQRCVHTIMYKVSSYAPSYPFRVKNKKSQCAYNHQGTWLKTDLTLSH